MMWSQLLTGCLDHFMCCCSYDVGQATGAPQGVLVDRLTPLPAPQMGTPAGGTAQRQVGASVTPVDHHLHEAAAAAAEADDSGSDDDFHDPLQVNLDSIHRPCNLIRLSIVT